VLKNSPGKIPSEIVIKYSLSSGNIARQKNIKNSFDIIIKGLPSFRIVTIPELAKFFNFLLNRLLNPFL
jgi:hypothetical protein